MENLNDLKVIKSFEDIEKAHLWVCNFTDYSGSGRDAIGSDQKSFIFFGPEEDKGREAEDKANSIISESYDDVDFDVAPINWEEYEEYWGVKGGGMSEDEALELLNELFDWDPAKSDIRVLYYEIPSAPEALSGESVDDINRNLSTVEFEKRFNNLYEAMDLYRKIMHDSKWCESASLSINGKTLCHYIMSEAEFNNTKEELKKLIAEYEEEKGEERD